MQFLVYTLVQDNADIYRILDFTQVISVHACIRIRNRCYRDSVHSLLVMKKKDNKCLQMLLMWLHYSSFRNFQRKLKVYVLHDDVMYTVMSDGN